MDILWGYGLTWLRALQTPLGLSGDDWADDYAGSAGSGDLGPAATAACFVLCALAVHVVAAFLASDMEPRLRMVVVAAAALVVACGACLMASGDDGLSLWLVIAWVVAYPAAGLVHRDLLEYAVLPGDAILGPRRRDGSRPVAQEALLSVAHPWWFLQTLLAPANALWGVAAAQKWVLGLALVAAAAYWAGARRWLSVSAGDAAGARAPRASSARRGS
jgi:hypothetical protein